MDEVSGPVQVRYTYGNMLVSQTRSASGSPATSFYGYDAHGNIAFLTDAAGSLTDTYDYDAWGNLVASTGSTVKNRLFAGEEFDPDLGLINLRARQYVPETGRFLTVIDPAAGLPQQPLTFNRYIYADGDPSDQVDPTGRDAALGYIVGLAAGTAVATMAVPSLPT